MKILLLGLSGAGKSTVAKLLAKHYKLDLIEADDEVEKANGGTWPKDNDNLDAFIDRIFGETNKKVINTDNIIYVISWMDTKVIKDFYNRGFIIFEMHADFDELLRRKENRDGVSEKQSSKFSNTYVSYFEVILSAEMKEFYELSIDTTNLPADRIFNEITSNI